MIDDEALSSIERLHKLKNDGVISEEEFEQGKARILFGNAKPAKQARVIGLATPAPDDWLGWALLPLKRYADFSGRSSRKEFWLFALMVGIALTGCTAFTVVDEYGILGDIGSIMAILVLLVTLVPTLAVQARRFHDQGKSGLLTLANLVPYVGALIVLGFMLIEGVHGDNEHGPDPVQR